MTLKSRIAEIVNEHEFLACEIKGCENKECAKCMAENIIKAIQEAMPRKVELRQDIFGSVDIVSGFNLVIDQIMENLK